MSRDRANPYELPPEAIEVTRDLYSHGFYIEAYVGLALALAALTLPLLATAAWGWLKARGPERRLVASGAVQREHREQQVQPVPPCQPPRPERPATSSMVDSPPASSISSR